MPAELNTSTLDAFALAQHSALSERRRMVRRAIAYIIASSIVLQTFGFSVALPAIAYWRTSIEVQIPTQTGTPTSVTPTCSEISSLLTTNPKGVRISWAAVPNATGYRLHTTFVIPSWDAVSVSPAWVWEAYSAFYPAGGTAYLSQDVFTGLTLGQHYPSGVATLKNILGKMPDGTTDVLRWNSANYYGQLIFQVEALFGDNWVSGRNEVRLPPRQIVATTSPINAGDSVTVVYSSFAGSTDYIECS